MNIRINKYISQCTGISRREADRVIKDGQVTVNGRRIKELGQLIDVKNDHVKLQRKLLRYTDLIPCYYMFHKPKNVLTTRFDSKNRPIVMDYFKRVKAQKFLFPVGRLDWNTEGLLLLTNDGDFSQKVSHPKNKITKTYMVKIKGKSTESSLSRLRKAKGLHAEVVRSAKTSQWIKIIIDEGKNRQIRRMCLTAGLDINTLRRVSIGRLNLSKLISGSFVKLNPADLEKIFIIPKELRK